MSKVMFIGCLHLGHENMAKHRGFYDSYEHDEHLIRSWNSVVTKRDLVYILGDITMEKDEYYPRLDELNGRKIVILGNHDLPKHTRKLLDYVENVAGAISYKGFLLTHVPIHPSEIHLTRGNIHAHIHHNQLEEVNSLSYYKDEGSKPTPSLNKYYNVDAKLINFKPVCIEDLIKER